MRSDTYYGKKASGYDAKRRTQQRWKLEHNAVAKMLADIKPRHLLDLPCGTGRFIELYGKTSSLRTVTCGDISPEMYRQAERKARSIKGPIFSFLTIDATDIKQMKPTCVDTVVCMRFLDLIDEATLDKVMRELSRVVVARGNIICTIRLGDGYVPKTNTATHDRQRWNNLLRRLGWRIEEAVPIFNAGWVVLKLAR